MRLSRLADYGVVVMCHMARTPEDLHNTAELAEATRLPLPTVKKLLKLLSRNGLLESRRGVNGGYLMARTAEQISLKDMLDAVEGPLVLAGCVDGSHEICDLEPTCHVAPRWNIVNDTIERVLSRVLLSEMM